MKDSKVLTIQDFSSYGQCSISVALPVLSAMGNETVALPVAVLSTHTSEFKDYVYTNLSDKLYDSIRHIKSYGGEFVYIYVGYLGKTKTISVVEKILEMYPHAKFVIDPAMAEGGELYDKIENDYIEQITKLCQKSYLCLPNLSEACFMAGCEYSPLQDKKQITKICDKLFEKGIKQFAITGVKLENTLNVIYGNENNITKLPVKEIEGKYYGAGDVFSSVVVGSLAQGQDVLKSLCLAIDFTQKAVEETSKDKAHWYGLKFEKVLPWLVENAIKK